MINQETIDKIISSINIVDIISEYIKLHKQGANFVGCCPFHDEKTASFIVSQTKNRFKCFGCGKSGNVINFIQEIENISFPQAIELLAKKSGVNVQSDYTPTPEEKARYAEKETIKIATKFAVDYFVANRNKDFNDYINTRKFKKETVDLFQLGFASNDWHKFETAAQKETFKSETLINASLVGKGDKGTYDYFRGRIMFPIFNITGVAVGFTGRTIYKEEQAKYLNSKDTALFKKGNNLFAINLAKNAIAKADECILLEGNYDVMRFHELGFSNTVAACGTALTKEQITIIRRFTNNILLCYDGDNAGQKATIRNAELLLSEGMNVRMISLPPDEDPDTFGLKGKEAVTKFLENKKDFVTWFYEKLTENADSIKIANAVKEIERIIALIPDADSREIYINSVVSKFKLNKKTIIQAVKRNTVKKIEEKQNGFINLETAEEAIKHEKKCLIADTMQTLVQYQAEGFENTILKQGELTFANAQQLNAITQVVEFINYENIFTNAGDETNFAKLCNNLVSLGFDVSICNYPAEESESYKTNYINAYAQDAAKIIEANGHDENVCKKIIETACNVLALLNDTTQTLYIKKYAENLSITVADLKKILKPFIAANKSKGALKLSAPTVDGKQYTFDINNLPEYVDKDFFYKNQYFAAQNKEGKKIFYVFRTNEGGLQVVGNFYIEPLFHVYDTDDTKNKRIVRINNAENGQSVYAEFQSEKMIDFGSFKKTLFNLGGNVFVRGKSEHHEKIIASIANQFPKCFEINEFGQQHEDFYAFANAIYADGNIKYTNELGLVKYKDNTYYSPAFSKIYSELRKSNDKYENDRWFIFKETNNTNFETWAKLVCQVYKENNNGHWALIFALMSAFRSDIFPINRLFTAPFFIGPTESGKTQVAVSIRSLFMHPDAPLFNLNSGTDAAFFSSMERYRDVPVIFEEYNDYQISDIKFQGLKAAVYDGEGKQKKKDATSKDIEVSKINCAVVLLGQEAPERDDGSLANRCILLHVPKKDDWTDEERNIFDELKSREKKGLSNVLLEILKCRETVREHFTATLNDCTKELKHDLNQDKDSHNSRLLNTIGLFLATTKLFETYIPQLKLPFSYKEFYTIARNKIITQSESLSTTNRVAIFFETMELLLNNDDIQQGREYKIEWQKSVSIQIDKKKTIDKELPQITQVLYLRIGLIQPMYAKIRGNEALKMNNLIMYLKDHPAYIGQIKSTRFSWKEYKDYKDEFDTYVKKTELIREQNTSAIAFDYKVLKDTLNIILEKNEDVDFPPSENDLPLLPKL